MLPAGKVHQVYLQKAQGSVSTYWLTLHNCQRDSVASSTKAKKKGKKQRSINSQNQFCAEYKTCFLDRSLRDTSFHQWIKETSLKGEQNTKTTNSKNKKNKVRHFPETKINHTGAGKPCCPSWHPTMQLT